MYLKGQQIVFRPEGSWAQLEAPPFGGLGLHLQGTCQPGSFVLGAGLSYEGLIPARRADVISTCFIRSEASKYVAPTNAESVLELNYQRNHSRFLTIAPHAQYLCELNNHPGRSPVILGIQLALTL